VLAAVRDFLRDVPAEGTRSQRRTYLEEYLSFLATALNRAVDELTLDELVDEGNAAVWLAAAAQGVTRRRPGIEGPRTKAAVASQAARITTLNTISRYHGRPLDLAVPKTSRGDRLTVTEAHQVLRLLSGNRPLRMQQPTWERSVAVIAVVVATGASIADLHPLRTGDVELDRPVARVRVDGQWCVLDALSRAALGRWLDSRRAITGRLQGGRVEQLWVTTNAPRPRPGRPAEPPGLPASVRALESAHRNLVLATLGAPLRLEQFRSLPPSDRDRGGEHDGSQPLPGQERPGAGSLAASAAHAR
jgi:integrase